MATIIVDVVSAETSIYSGEASFVALPGVGGELGILPGHVPLITSIKPGEVRVTGTDGKMDSIFVAGGILEVQPNRVTVLADVAVRSKDLDEARTQQAIEEAKKRQAKTKGEIDLARVQAEISALAAQLAFIKKLRAK